MKLLKTVVTAVALCAAFAAQARTLDGLGRTFSGFDGLGQGRTTWPVQMARFASGVEHPGDCGFARGGRLDHRIGLCTRPGVVGGLV